MKKHRDELMICMRLERIGRFCRGSVLDVGCGDSILEGCLDSGTYFGIDIRSGDIVGSALDLPVSKLSVDTVVLCEVLEHLEDPARAIGQAAEVARERIVISVPNEYSLVRLARLVFGREIEPEPEHLLDLTASHLERSLARCGFKVAERTAFPLRLQGFPLVPLKSRFGYWTIVVADRVTAGPEP